MTDITLTVDEIDQLIAKELFGWEWQKPRHGPCCTCQRCGRANEDFGDPCHDNSCEMTEDIQNAWKIVEKMEEKGFFPQVFKNLNNFEVVWQCDFIMDQGIYGEGKAPTPAMAICMAAVDYIKNHMKEWEK
jgi:hypothetical protein